MGHYFLDRRYITHSMSLKSCPLLYGDFLYKIDETSLPFSSPLLFDFTYWVRLSLVRFRIVSRYIKNDKTSLTYSKPLLVVLKYWMSQFSYILKSAQENALVFCTALKRHYFKHVLSKSEVSA